MSYYSRQNLKPFHRARARALAKVIKRLYAITAHLRRDPLYAHGVNMLMKDFSPWLRGEERRERWLSR